MSNPDEPFGRQPQRVTIILLGENEDIDYWIIELRRRLEFKGDIIQQLKRDTLVIHPRAVND